MREGVSEWSKKCTRQQPAPQATRRSKRLLEQEIPGIGATCEGEYQACMGGERRRRRSRRRKEREGLSLRGMSHVFMDGSWVSYILKPTTLMSLLGVASTIVNITTQYL